MLQGGAGAPSWRLVRATAFPAVAQELFSEVRWQELKGLFLAELYRLQSLTPASLLNIHLQVSPTHPSPPS